MCVGYRVSWPDERFIWTTAGSLADDLERDSINKHALILAGPGVAVRAPGAEGESAKSRLYDPGYSHGYRQAKGKQD